MIRSAIALSASAWRNWHGRSRCVRRWKSCCSRLRRRCSSWARNGRHASRFPFFCDFGPDLAKSVTEGRRREFARFERFRDERARAEIPDPCDAATFTGAALDWSQRAAPGYREWLDIYRALLKLRRRELMPRLAAAPGGSGLFSLTRPTLLQAEWKLGDGSRYRLLANLGNAPQDAPPQEPGRTLYASPGALDAPGRLSPWSVIWRIGEYDE